MKTRKQAQNIKICLLGIGAFFGEYEILNQIPRVFSAKCYSSKVSLFYISRRKLFSYLHDNYHLQDFLMKQATQTHLWHLNQLQKINYDQNFIKISDNLIKGKAIKQFYKYRPIRSSVADLEEVINKDSSLRNLTAKNNNQNDENIKNKIEITFYEQKFFRGKRAVSNNTQNNNNNKNETKSIKIVNKVKVEEKGNNEDWNDIKSNIKKMNLGSKIVDVVSNNEKALKILKKQKDFSSLGLFFKFFETDKTKENLIRTDKKKRPMSAPFFSKDEANVTKNDSKLQFKRSFPSKPLDHNKSNSKEFVNYHLRRKSQQISNNTTLFVKQKMLTAGIHKRRQSSGNMFSQPKIPSDFKGILNIHSFQRH